MNSALSHLTVLDLSRVLAGPWAGQVLADLGAEVIKVERPGSGDDTRGWGPPFLRDAQGNDSADAAYYLCANRNKKSITLDITTPEGQSIVRELARKSDVVIENFKVGGLAAYGLDYASLCAVNAQIIYCSITGFGQTGPYASRAGYDLLVQAMGGLMSITGRRRREPAPGRRKPASPSPTFSPACTRRSGYSRRSRTANEPGSASTSTWDCSMCRWPVWRIKP